MKEKLKPKSAKTIHFGVLKTLYEAGRIQTTKCDAHHINPTLPRLFTMVENQFGANHTLKAHGKSLDYLDFLSLELPGKAWAPMQCCFFKPEILQPTLKW
jgi:hypothetical protein